MKKLLSIALLAGGLSGAPLPSVLVVNVNSQLVSLLRNAAGFNAAAPYAEVMILHPSSAVDGYRIHVIYFDGDGVQHDLTRDAISQPSPDDRPIVEIFQIDAVSITATATPYKLQTGAIATQ